MINPVDVSDAPEIAPEPDPEPKPPQIDHQPVAGSEDLPDDVRNGEIDPTLAPTPPEDLSAALGLPDDARDQRINTEGE